MDRQQAKTIIKRALESPFDKNAFAGFVKNLLNSIEDAPFTYQGNYIPNAYKQYISKFERIGKYKDGENLLDILIVTLKKETSLEYARTMQRNFIAWYLNGSRGGVRKDAALVAFVSPDEIDWRFSLVKMDYRFDQTKTGKIKVKEEFTPARRWSFLVGENEKSHTAQSRLLPILLNDETNPTLQELEAAFSIEKVTKEFFEKYRELFLRLKESLDEIIKKDEKVNADFENKNIDTADFAKKLLGQIVFLYFLQKKGWFGVKRDEEWGSGTKHFLRELFNKKHGDYDNFYDDILEPLFYEALRLERPGDYYSRFNCRIPFLNGGLFDPINDYDWWNVDILLPDEIFSNERKTKEGDIGDGILDIFDRYNFTVKEDEPLEKDVAIDPEMLGKVFENLLEVKDRKSQGTYYTPREIVHYMCQESLSNYLANELNDKVDKEDIKTLIDHGESVVENESYIANKGHETERYTFKLPSSVRDHAIEIDEKLASIRVCDPAVGSGAFPVGMMNEIVRARNALTPYMNGNSKRIPYYFKRQAIQNCLYGVDIDPGAVEITKLRLWLSLIVDEKDRSVIQPLPNLDYKIMQGNSLLSEFMGIDFDSEDVGKNGQLFITDEDIDVLIERLKEKKDQYLNKGSVSEKQKLKHEIEDLIIQIFETKLKKQKTTYFNQMKAIEDKYNGFPNKEQREDLIRKEKEKLKRTTGFDLEQFENQLREYTTGNKVRPFFPWRLYFAEIFHEKEGFDVVIANPPYINVNEMKKEAGKYKHQFLTPYGSYDIYILFFERSVEILKEKGILTYITSNKYFIADYAKKLRKFFVDNTKILTLLDLADCVRIFEHAYVSPAITILQKGKIEEDYEVSLGLLRDEDIYNLDNLKLIPLNINDLIAKSNYVFDIYSAGDNKSILIKLIDDTIALKEIANVRTGIMGFGYWEMEPYIREGKASNYIRIITNGQIGRYTFLFNKKTKLYKKFFHNPYFDIENAPINSNTKKLFRSKKIIIRGVAKKLSANYDEKGLGVLVAVHTAIPIDDNYHPYYLLSLINSKLFNWFHLAKYYTARIPMGSLKYPISFLQELPIKAISIDEQRTFIDLVDKILTITKESDYLEDSAKQAKVCDYEKQIDQLVYELYELTPEEIEIVESKSK